VNCRSLNVSSVAKLCCIVAAQEAGRVPLCNGDGVVSKSDDDSDQRGAMSFNDAALSSATSVNERLLASSVNDSLPLTDTSLSRSSLNDTSLLSGEATSLSQLASEDIGHSLVAQP